VSGNAAPTAVSAIFVRVGEIVFQSINPSFQACFRFVAAVATDLRHFERSKSPFCPQRKRSAPRRAQTGPVVTGRDAQVPVIEEEG